MSWKRRIAAMVGDVLDIDVVRRGREWWLIEQNLLRRYLREFDVDCVFDIGANAGQYAGLLRTIGYRGPIVSVEPIPSLAAHLRLAAARDPSWYIEALALDEIACERAFHVMANSEFSSLKAPSSAETHLFERMNVVTETISVETARLDQLFDRYQALLRFQRPFVKMDTQGHDLAVARGAGERLDRFVGLQSELAIKRIYEDQSDYREAIAYYESRGFVLCSLVPNNAGHFPDLVEIDCVMYNARARGQQ